MTIGELIDRIRAIEELETELELIQRTRDEFLDPTTKINNLEQLISFYRRQEIDE